MHSQLSINNNQFPPTIENLVSNSSQMPFNIKKIIHKDLKHKIIIIQIIKYYLNNHQIILFHKILIHI